jgi:hypothetical protein
MSTKLGDTSDSATADDIIGTEVKNPITMAATTEVANPAVLLNCVLLS